MPNLESSQNERPKVSKLWGHEDIVHNADGYCGKLLHIKPNVQCSLHYHKLKHETFTAIEGEVWVEYYPEFLNLRAMGPKIVSVLVDWQKDSLELPPYTPHRFWSDTGGILAEFSTLHCDTDVVRIEESRPL